MSARIFRIAPPQLKPGLCPFCHSPETGWTFQQAGLWDAPRFFAFCFACHARGPECRDWEEAIKGWNDGAR